MLEAFGLSDRGCVRSNNEDYFIIDSARGLFILADGMGGANAGEYASHHAAETLHRFLLNAPDSDDPELLEEGFLRANQAVRNAGDHNTALEGMGTTLVAARQIHNGYFQIGSVGDSRAYRLSDGSLSLLTKDQTWVAEVGPRLGLSDEALRKHPMRHVLTMAVGTAEELRVCCRTVQLSIGDQLLLCSDGLHGVLAEKFLEQALNCEKTLPEKCHYLVEAAKSAGGPDNVTVVLIRLV